MCKGRIYAIEKSKIYKLVLSLNRKKAKFVICVLCAAILDLME